MCNNRSFRQTDPTKVLKKQICAELPPMLQNCKSQKKVNHHYECSECEPKFYLNNVTNPLNLT